MCTYPKPDHALTHWKCALRCCADCPCINLPNQDTDNNMNKQHPQFGFTCITSLHIVLIMVEFHWKTRKSVTCVNTKIHQKNLENIHQKRASDDGNNNFWFIASFYKPAIQKLEFHLPHERILGTNHCGEMRRTAFKRRELFQDVLCHCDYAERVVSSFANQIQT